MDIDTKSFKYKYNNNIYFKSKILTKALEKIKCSKCDRIVMRSNMSRHKKSKICMNAT